MGSATARSSTSAATRPARAATTRAAGLVAALALRVERLVPPRVNGITDEAVLTADPATGEREARCGDLQRRGRAALRDDHVAGQALAVDVQDEPGGAEADVRRARRRVDA